MDFDLAVLEISLAGNEFVRSSYEILTVRKFLELGERGLLNDVGRVGMSSATQEVTFFSGYDQVDR